MKSEGEEALDKDGHSRLGVPADGQWDIAEDRTLRNWRGDSEGVKETEALRNVRAAEGAGHQTRSSQETGAVTLRKFPFQGAHQQRLRGTPTINSRTMCVRDFWAVVGQWPRGQRGGGQVARCCVKGPA